MAKNVELMGAVFPDCPAVLLPTHEGPLARFTDVSDSQAVAADVAQGKAFYLADGTKTTGTNQGGGGGGGGGGTIKPNARLVLIDYDGSIVDSYTQSEINALSALPASPDHSGDEIPLTSQGWNWTLAEIREQLTAMPEQAVWVGQMYVPTDGKTHIVIYIDPSTPENTWDMTIRYSQSKSRDVVVDWGDGSEPQTYSGTSAANRDHTYASPGRYDITLKPTTGDLAFAGSSSNSTYGSTSSNYLYKATRIEKIYIGEGLRALGIDAYAFHRNRHLETITIPNGPTSIGNSAFNGCCALKAIIVPNGVTTFGTQAFNQCRSLQYALAHTQLTTTNGSFFQQCYSLRAAMINVQSGGSSIFGSDDALQEVTLCYGTATIPASMLSSCFSLNKICIPDSVTSIGGSAFSGCTALTEITIPKNVTSIGNSAFSSCAALVEVHVKPTTPPTLGTSVFSSLVNYAKIYVPYSADHSILAAYQGAANWSTYASQMVEEAE